VRRPGGAPFGWLEARLLNDGWLARLGPDASAVLLFLALAADRHGASFYGRDKMALLVGLDRTALDRALARLLELELVAHRPWSDGHPDGVWQLLPLPAPPRPSRGSTSTIGAALAELRRSSYHVPLTARPERGERGPASSPSP
jgi:hypothetical protein